MTELQAFLFALDDEGDWVTSTFTQLEPLLESVQAALQDEDRVALIHVGFWQPSIAEVAALAAPCSGALIVSDPAAGALGEHLMVTAAAIGCIRGVVFRRALDGRAGPIPVEEPGVVAERTDPPVPEPVAQDRSVFARAVRGNWLTGLAARDAELAAQASAAGVVDDETYLALEATLPRRLRQDLGLARFAAVAGAQPDADNILENLWASPPWLMDLRLARLGLTVRQSNVFSSNDLQTVADISAMGATGLLKLPNMGQGSVHGLRKSLLDALESAAWLPPDRSNSIGGMHTEADVPQGLNSLRSGFKAAAALLDDAERHVWAGRIGFECPQMTLQELAESINLSRERVRQIESRIYRRVEPHPFWQELALRLDSALQSRSSALRLSDLPAVDVWFAEAPSLATALASTLRHLLADRFGAFEIAGVWVVSHLRPQEWGEVFKSARALLESGARDRIEETVARWQCDQLLLGRGEELRAALWAEVTADAQWAARLGQPRRLVSLGSGADDVVLAVLESSEEPLHYNEIHRRAVALCGSAHDARSIQNAASAVGILFDRGAYGLPGHCPLTGEELALVRAEVEDLMSGGEPARQWHASELCDALLERDLSFDGQLTKYVVNYALKGCSGLVDLRRMVWGLGGEWQAGAASRLDVRQAVIGLLEAQGRPMTTAEVRARLAAVRGVNQTFQIFPADPLVRIGSGLWGLLHRDVDVSGAQPLLARLREALQLRQTGLHLSELPTVPGLEWRAGANPDSAWMAVAETAGIRVDRGQYTYLGEWGASRRLAVPDAVKAAVADVGAEGVVFEDVCRRVNGLTQREVPSGHVSQALRGMDLSYDSARRLWMPESTEAES